MKTVGYLINSREGLNGETGLYYNYILAGNGLFIAAESRLITARIPVAHGEVRGLAPVETKFVLTYGSIPQRFFDLSLNVFLADTTREHYVAIIGDAGYHIYAPIQDREQGNVTYEVGDSVILEMHSHGTMTAGFSSQDNRDEKGMKVYGVVGNLRSTPAVKLRLGVYGYYLPLLWKDVFDGCLNGAVDTEKEEVICENDVHSITEKPPIEHESDRGWLWWYRKLCR